MRYPVLHGRDNVHLVNIVTYQQQPAVFEVAQGFLIGQDFAACEIVRSGWGDLYHDFGKLVAVGNAVVGSDGGFECFVHAECLRVFANAAHLGKAEGFLPAPVGVDADGVPDAVAVD